MSVAHDNNNMISNRLFKVLINHDSSNIKKLNNSLPHMNQYPGSLRIKNNIYIEIKILYFEKHRTNIGCFYMFIHNLKVSK